MWFIAIVLVSWLMGYMTCYVKLMSECHYETDHPTLDKYKLNFEDVKNKKQRKGYRFLKK